MQDHFHFHHMQQRLNLARLHLGTVMVISWWYEVRSKCSNTIPVANKQILCFTVKEVADAINVSFGTVQTILTSNLNMHLVAIKFEPRVLTAEQKQHRLKVCTDFHQQTRDDPTFMSGIITGGESWAFGYVWPREQAAVFTVGEAALSKTEEGEAGQERDQKHALHFLRHSLRTVNLLPRVILSKPSSTVTFRGVLCSEGEHSVQIHHENTPVHSALKTGEFFSHPNTTVGPHPPLAVFFSQQLLPLPQDEVQAEVTVLTQWRRSSA